MPIDPVATSLAIARSYGFPPALAVPTMQPARFEPVKADPVAIEGVVEVAPGVPARAEQRGRFVDEYA